MKDLLEKRTSLFAWIILTIGMWVIVLYEARDVGFNGSQWFWLLAIIALVSGLCVWIINLGGNEDDTTQ